MRRLLSPLLLAALSLAAPGYATVHRVPSDFTTIQAGIDAASESDTVRVAPGTYVESLNLLGKEIVVRSEEGPTVTIITADSTINLVNFLSGENRNTVLEGFTLLGGFRAVACDGSAPTVRGNLILFPHFFAVHLTGGSPAVVENNTIVGGASDGISTYSTSRTMGATVSTGGIC